MKKIIKSKVFIIVVGVLLISMIVFFPRVKTTRLDGELLGQYTTVKETFLLHRKTSIKTTNVCVVGITTRVTEVKFYLDGSVKSMYNESCALETNLIVYSKSGNLERVEALAILPTGISKTEIEYNEKGQEIFKTISLAQNETNTTTKYDGFYQSERMKKIYLYGVVVGETVQEYDEDGSLIKISTEEFNVSGETLLVEFTTYNVDDTEDFRATCDSDGLCSLEYYVTDDFSFTKNNNSDSYTFINGDDTLYHEIIGDFFSNEIDSIINSLKQKASD